MLFELVTTIGNHEVKQRSDDDEENNICHSYFDNVSDTQKLEENDV